MEKIHSILQEVLEKVKPSKEDAKEMADLVKDFLKKIKSKLKASGAKAEVFVGGSFAKNTVIKKDEYDVDIFLRFDKKYKDAEISEMTKKLLGSAGEFKTIHGSRDYFKIPLRDDFFIELVPVAKVSTPEQSENITDLSYSHVKYVNKKVKTEKMLDEIRLAKAFCYATQCYGAESYINGFSGYALELLTYYHGGFLKFVKAMTKVKIGEKEVIDIEKHFKNKAQVLMDINESKLNSPVILIDPTHKHRNALAALSDETLLKFQKACSKFLKSPSVKSFDVQKTDLEKIEKDAAKNKFEYILIEARTEKQEGDVAGTKLLKFYNHLTGEIEKFFEIKKKGFNYNSKKSARYFFVVKSRGDIEISGPLVKDEDNVKAFEKVHSVYFTKKGRIFAKERVDFSVKGFMDMWKKKNSSRVKEMYISELKIV